MSNTTIQQSLVDIEQNLKKLDSARNQVGNIADKSSQLITSVTSVIESIEVIKETFKNDENYLKTSLNKSLEEFSQTLSKEAQNVNKKASEISSKHEKVVDGAIQKLEEFHSNLSEVQTSILEFDLERNLNKIRTEFSKLSEIIDENEKNTNQEIAQLKSQMEIANAQHKKFSKMNLIVSAAGFILIIIVFLLLQN